MINPNFSWIWSKYDARGYAQGEYKITELKVVPIAQMKPFNQEQWNDGLMNRIQMSTYEHRVIKDTPYKYWNGCIFIDIDYKKWVSDHAENFVNAQTILNDMYEFMKTQYTSNFYYAETSRSGIGFHFIFYYDCEHTHENFDYYNRYTQKLVERAFEQCNYYEIIHYKGVFDKCSKSFCQTCYLTRNQERFNELCDGHIVDYPNVSIECTDAYRKEFKQPQTNKWCFKFKCRNDNIKQVEYIEHIQRWRLFESLSMIFKDDISLRREWERCALMIPERNGHNLEYYKHAPYRLDWNRKLDGNEYVDIELLEKFGYEIDISVKPTIILEDLVELLNKNINIKNDSEFYRRAN